MITCIRKVEISIFHWNAEFAFGFCKFGKLKYPQMAIGKPETAETRLKNTFQVRT